MMHLSGHTVLITGGGSGIGQALAHAFLKRDNTVVICGRNEERLAQAAAQHPRLHTVRADVGCTEDVQRLAEYMERDHGGVSILVNNAGVQRQVDFFAADATPTLAQVQEEVQINLTGVLQLTALCLPQLRRRAPSAVVNVSSGLGLVPKKSAPVYCGTKAALHLFTKALRYQAEDAGDHVFVFEVLPPLVDTAMTAGRGTGKISPEQVAADTLRAMERDRTEVRVGKVRVLALLNRWIPPVAERILRDA